MSRIYNIQLECGCMISEDEDGGGGLIPCSYMEDNPKCKASEYFKEKEKEKKLNEHEEIENNVFETEDGKENS